MSSGLRARITRPDGKAGKGHAPEKRGRLGRHRRSLLLLVATALAAAGSRYAYWQIVEGRFEAIAPDVLYKSGVMGPKVLLRKIEDHHIRSVIDLRNEGPEVSERERRVVESAGVQYFCLPTDQVPALDVVDAYLAVMDDPSNLPALVHCHHGYGRAVLFSALYRIEFEDWDNERARRATRFFSWRGSFAPGTPKGEFLSGYAKRLER